MKRTIVDEFEPAADGAPEIVDYKPVGSAWDLFYKFTPEKMDVSEIDEILFDGPSGTGKTLACLVWIHAKMMEYPGTNVLIARKVRESMASTCLRTFEEQVLSIDSPEIMDGRDRAGRTAYLYPNGSRATIGGILDVERMKSSEYDIIYINEVTEVSLRDYAIALTRLRPSTKANACPYKLLLSDCNPSYPTHYINTRFDQSIEPSTHRMRMLSRHEDNPRWFNKRKNAWTKDGLVYIRKLDSLPDKTERARMRHGLWVGEAGRVYDEFDSNYHIIDAKDVPPIIYYVGAYDPSPSSRNASVLQIWGVSEEGRGYLVEEAHMVGKGIDWWAEQAVKFWHKYRPRQIVCDPSNPGMIELFNNRIGARNGNPMSRIAIKANNEHEAGIAQVKSCLSREAHLKSCQPSCAIPGRHGKSRIYIVRNSLSEYDAGKDLDAVSNRPRCTAEEFLALTWKKTKDGQEAKDEWEDSIPHDGLDCLRYFCMFSEQRSLGTNRSRPKNPYQDGTVGHLMWKEGRFRPLKTGRVAV